MATIEKSSEVAAKDHPEEVDVSIVAPAYNEGDNLRGLIPELIDVVDGCKSQYWEIVLVDDGSTDDTGDVIHHAAAVYKRIRGVCLRRNFGQSAALAAGIDAATGDVIVTMDADGQNDPEDIPVLLDRLDEGFDCVSGNRVERRDPLGKRIPSAIQTKLAKLTGPDIADFGCTLTAYRAEALDDVHLYGEEHRYIPAQLYDRGYAIGEVEVNHRPREHGDSHYGIGRLVRGFSDLVFHLLWNRYSTRPFHLFGGTGFVLFALGLLVGGYYVGLKYLAGVALAPNLPQLLLSVGMVLFGFLLVMFGVLVQYLTRIHYGGARNYRVDQVVE